MQVSNRVLSADGTEIAFDRIGAGPTLVLIDAALGYRGFGPMGPLAAQMASDFTVVTYDRRGRGASTDIQPYSVDREIDDLHALIEASGESAFVHGYSSGAVLALLAAGRRLPIAGLSLLEPPIELDGENAAAPDPLEAEITKLVAAGRRGDAVEHFNRSIGVPEEYMTGMRDAPWWPAAEEMAHTLVYDLVISRPLPSSRLADIDAPTLVIDSEQSDERLHGWAVGIANALPNGTLRTLPGEWHGIAPEVLTPALIEFFAGAHDSGARR
jgi:pimeloyl-ACP methyl ester carboxylesterase